MRFFLAILVLIPGLASAAQITVNPPAEWMNIHPAVDLDKPHFIELPSYLDHSDDIDVREALPVDQEFWKMNTAQGPQRH